MHSWSRLVVMAMLGLVASRSAAQESRTTWTFSASARESNELDREINGEAQEERTLDNANVGLQMRARTERAQIGLFGRVGANVYRGEVSRGDRLNYGGGLSYAQTSSSRLNWNFASSVSRDFRAETLTDVGVVAPNVQSTAANASWGLRYRTSPRTTVSTSVAYTFAKLQTDDPLSGSQLVLDVGPFDEVFPTLSSDADPGAELVVPDAEEAVLRILASEGLRSRESESQWATATVGIARRATERTTFGLDVAGGYRTIESNAFAAREGAEAGARAWIERTVGAASAVLANYTYRRSLALEPDTTIQLLMGGVSYSPSGRSVRLNLQGGAGYFQAGSVDFLTPTVNASLSASLTRTTSLSLSYRRQFQQSLGFGQTLLIDFANLSLSQDFGSRVTLTALGGASLGSDPLEEESRFDAIRAGGTLTVRILEPLSAGTSFMTLEQERVTQTIESDQRRNLWTFYVTFSKSWN